MYSIDMQPIAPPYRCRLCAATSYRRLTHRGSDGVMQYSGLYRCSGCSVTFCDPLAWREGAEISQIVSEPAGAEPSCAASGAGQSFANAHPTMPRMPGEPIGYGRSAADLNEIREAAKRANRSKGRRR